MSDWRYIHGLQDLGNSVYAYLQPDGSWGWSNAGIVADSGVSLLVDTLYDLKLTQEMLTSMRRSIPAAEQIDMLVNTHANGDHCYGNQLVGEAQIIASARTAEEMAGTPPAIMAGLLQRSSEIGPLGSFLKHIFGSFDFEGITLTLPTRTFERQLDLMVGTKEVKLFEVGPAHTRGDTMIYVPGDRVIFTGDILFIGAHPIMWEGPVGNWLRACETILGLDVEVIVPGHGPITDKQGVRRLKNYFEYLEGEARRRYEAGMSEIEAARDISMDAYADWIDGERLVVNVASLYREWRGELDQAGRIGFFGLMAEYAGYADIS